MKKTVSFFKSLKGKIVLIVCILLAGIIIRQSLENLYEEKQVQNGTVTTYEDGSRVGRSLSYAETVPEDNKILQAFYEQFPTATMLVACEEDLTNDGKKDLVVIYNTCLLYTSSQDIENTDDKICKQNRSAAERKSVF